MKKQILLLALFITPSLMNAQEDYSIQDLIDNGTAKTVNAKHVLSLDSKNLTSLHGLNNIQNIEDTQFLVLVHNKITDIVGYFDNLPNLKDLYLSYNNISNIRGVFDNLLNLKTLYISHNHISQEDQEYLQGFCDARGINLQAYNQTEDPLADISLFKFAD